MFRPAQIRHTAGLVAAALVVSLLALPGVARSAPVSGTSDAGAAVADTQPTTVPGMRLDRERPAPPTRSAAPTPDAHASTPETAPHDHAEPDAEEPDAGAVHAAPESTTTIHVQPETPTSTTAPSTILPPTSIATTTTAPEIAGAEPFRLIGISLPRPPTADLRVRVHGPDGWSEWQDVPFDPDHAPDDWTGEGSAGALVSEPIWVGEADDYELAGDESDLEDIEVLLVREDPDQPVTEEAGALAPRIGLDQPLIRARSSWGARPHKSGPLRADELKVGYVHHTAGSNTYSTSEVSYILRSIQTFHMDGQGWDDIAYNFLVDRFGRIWEGREDSTRHAVIGGHAKGFNTGTVGVAAIGNFSTTGAPSAMLSAIGETLGWKLFLHGARVSGTVPFFSGGSSLYPEGALVNLNRITPHQATSSTGCPGGSVVAGLGTIRSVASAAHADAAGVGAFDSLGVSIGEDGTPLIGDFDGDGNSDVVLYGPGPATDAVYLGQTSGGLSRRSTSVSGVYEPFVGDFDGDYRDDVFWYAPGPARDYIWLGRADGTFQTIRPAVNATYEPIPGDYDDDDATDIIWYAAGPTPDYVWFGDGDGTFSSKSMPVRGTYRPFVGDFDGDQYDDVFWYAPGTTRDYIWLGRPGSAFSTRRPSVTGTYVPVVGDFDGNHRDDIIWYGPGGAADYFWVAAGGASFSDRSLRIDGTFTPLVGDFTGGGVEDVFWYAPGSARDYLWRFDSSANHSVVERPVNGALDARVVYQGCDGRADLLWYAPGGAADYLWFGRS